MQLTIPRREGVRLDDYCGAWCIEASRGHQLAELARNTDLAAHIDRQTQLDRETTSNVVTTDDGSLAVVQVAGVLMKSETSLTTSTSTVRLRQDLRRLADDDAIRGVMLLIDSPGGTAAGTADAAAEVRRLAAAKPTHAFIEDLGASAAYWLACPADRIVANTNDASIGSVGTMMVLHDVSVAAEREGVESVVIATGDLKGTAVPGSKITDAQREYLRTLVDSTQASFNEAVRRGRGMTDSQLAAVKSGAVFPATEAKRLGLIDDIASFDDALADLAAAARTTGRTARTSRPTATIATPTRTCMTKHTSEENTSAFTRAVRLADDAAPQPAATRDADPAPEPVRQAEPPKPTPATTKKPDPFARAMKLPGPNKTITDRLGTVSITRAATLAGVNSTKIRAAAERGEIRSVDDKGLYFRLKDVRYWAASK